MYELLRAGEIDFAWGILYLPLEQDIIIKYGKEGCFSCLIRNGHPLEKKKMTLKSYLSFPHIAITSGSEKTKQIDEALAKIGKKRKITVRTPTHRSALTILQNTDSILTLPERVGSVLSDKYDVSLKSLPFKSPTYNFAFMWHKQFDQDPSHKWFRRMLFGIK